jgi:SAM-dependent methyltransferase
MKPFEIPDLPQASDSTAADEEAMAGLGTHRRVRELFDVTHGSLVIDAGAGRGVFTDWLVQSGYQVIALGIDRHQFRGCAPFVECNLDDGLPIASATANAIVAIELIEHLETPLRFVREATRCLTVNGILVITTPNVLSISAKLSLLLRNYPTQFGDSNYYANGHVSPISRLTISRIAERSGLVVDAIGYNVGKLPLPWLRHRLPLRSSPFRNEVLGESLIVKLRKVRQPQAKIVRG